MRPERVSRVTGAHGDVDAGPTRVDDVFGVHEPAVWSMWSWLVRRAATFSGIAAMRDD
jgi:hypothetical protein